jgi:putative spermidine/putrescine transport system permease protein
MISMLIELQISQLLNWGFAAALSTVLLVATVGGFMLLTRVVRVSVLWEGPDSVEGLGARRSMDVHDLLRAHLAVPGGAGHHRRTARVQLGGFSALPATFVLLRWFENFFSRRDWMEATVNSFKIGFLTAGLATVLGTAAAYGLVRGRSRRKEGLYAFFISPMIVPNIVFALALYYLFSKLKMVGSMWSLVLGHTVLRCRR